MHDKLSLKVACSVPDDKGRRLVITTWGRRQHSDKFDVDTSFQRQKWREAAIKSLAIWTEWDSGGDQGDAIHRELESLLQAAVEEADATPTGPLWQPAVASMASIASQSTDWLWQGFIPLGAISVIDGDPGLGKSQLTVDLTARVTRGDAMPPQNAPDGAYKPRGVLLLNVEDDPARTLRPRLEAAGAVLSRVHTMRTMTYIDGEDERPVSLPLDLPAIEDVIRQHDVAMVVLDPFVAYLDGKLSVNNDADVRQCLGQVAAVAESTGCAFVLVRHLNKKSGLSAVYRGGGSIGITGAARAVFMVGVDPVDSESRVFACVKSNLAPEPQSLRFHIEAVGGTSRVRWGDACDVSAHDLCTTPKAGGKDGKADAARAIIAELLADGPRGSNEVLGACLDAGLSERSYHRARKAMGIRSERVGFGSDGQWLLTMPANGFHHNGF